MSRKVWAPEGNDSSTEISVPETKKEPDKRAIEIPSNLEYFLDNADVPQIKIPYAKGRQTWPLGHDLIRGLAVNHLYRSSGGIPPSAAQVDAFISVLKAQAMLNGRKDEGEDWSEDLLEKDAVLFCIFTLIQRKHPEPWVATAGQILDAANVLAAKERVAKPKDWPKSPSQMSVAIKERHPLGLGCWKKRTYVCSRKTSNSNAGWRRPARTRPLPLSRLPVISSSRPSLRARTVKNAIVADSRAMNNTCGRRFPTRPSITS